jgi:hypothetical protein
MDTRISSARRSPAVDIYLPAGQPIRNPAIAAAVVAWPILAKANRADEGILLGGHFVSSVAFTA